MSKESPAEPFEAGAFYVSPRSGHGGDGSRAKPFATLGAALAALPPSGGGTILLLSGTYREEALVRPPSGGEAGAQPLLIAAAPGEEPVFDGGEWIAHAEPWNGEAGMYLVHADDIQCTFPSESGYLDIWDPAGPRRYRKMFDADGARAFPGSACLLSPGVILIHTADGRDPAAIGLRRNRLARGLSIARGAVTVRGLRFENYLGGPEARAVTVSRPARDVEIADCRFFNCVRGFSLKAEDVRVVRCDLRGVGLGVVTYGVGTEIRDCVIQAATGVFAITDLNQHLRDGIRFYSPAIGGSVSGCVTAGFWAGLYVKTETHLPTARPMRFERNRFLDGVMAGSLGPQPLNVYRQNLVGPNEEKVDPVKAPLLQSATLEENYFFDGGGSAGRGNTVGPEPFAALAEGDLAVRSGVPVPNGAEWKPLRVEWMPAIAAQFRRQMKTRGTVEAGHSGPLRWVGGVSVTASSRGAIVTATLSGSATSILSYRKPGESAWRKVRGRMNRSATSGAVAAVAPVEPPSGPEAYPVLFPLLGGRLEPDTAYEFTLEAEGAEPSTEAGHFVTRGGPKRIAVRAGANVAPADGSPERPFPQLQAALDRALPGDTVVLEKGVYTQPAFLAHGGEAGAPLVIEGAGETATILDSGGEAPVLLELAGAGHVTIRGMQFRWFGNAGLSATGSEAGTIERCRFLNAAMSGGATVNGSGVLLTDSPRWTVEGSLLTRLERGVEAIGSPGLTLRNNTAFRNLYVAAFLIRSTAGSTLEGNSFTFTGNDSVSFSEESREPFATLSCDFNNYGTLLPATAAEADRIAVTSRYGYQPPGKAIVAVWIAGKLTRFHRMQEWRDFAGKDRQSIFADPEYADPLAADFHLLPTSPNCLPEGRVIGAYPAMEEEQRMRVTTE